MQVAWKMRDELSVGSDGLLLRHQKLVIRRCLWDRVIELAHQGHQRAAKAKAVLWSMVWFPGMDSLVDDRVRRCHSCAITAIEQPITPVITEEASTRLWSKVCMDFGSFPDGWLMLVLLDSHLRFPVVELVVSTVFENVKPMLVKTFALFGLPEELRTDNGPPFQGQDFKDYLDRLAVCHHRITPHWPQANGDVERFMRTLNRALRTGVKQGEGGGGVDATVYKSVSADPHSTTGYVPDASMFKQLFKDLLVLKQPVVSEASVCLGNPEKPSRALLFGLISINNYLFNP
ncbi:hypothetical protein NDU88_004643 [Pleurodeles waltl]|uniref:Gypsy retrotransposon integrase-like protein 1 n=1 Tax=Pleurodeles waltl TaxID=8319 RepID=A0AAV7QCL7_PLEWA|nr:hypothetical protein NDU88_004643 [Pleurodeles waltl]